MCPTGRVSWLLGADSVIHNVMKVFSEAVHPKRVGELIHPRTVLEPLLTRGH